MAVSEGNMPQQAGRHCSAPMGHCSESSASQEHSSFMLLLHTQAGTEQSDGFLVLSLLPVATGEAKEEEGNGSQAKL